MKSPLILLTVIIILFSSCNGNENKGLSDKNDKEINLDSTSIIDSTSIDKEETELNVFTVNAIPDGPENSFFLKGPVDNNDEELPYPKYNVLHVIPDEGYGSDDRVDDLCLSLIESNFQFWGELGEDDCKVEVFYTRDKTKLLAQFDLLNGKADGIVNVYLPNGDLYIKREYSEGVWTASIKSPYGSDWDFNQSASSLIIKDTENAFSTENGLNYVRIMPTLNFSNKDNSLYKIVQKESFKNPFQINEENFTGILEGYQSPYMLEVIKEFELSFVDGRLDGDVKIYNFWGALQLHEIFKQGILDSTVYVMDPEEMDGVAKPIIYLYPEKEMRIKVMLDFNGELTHTYPKYNNGWNVLAKPDGTLIDNNGKEYYALYWEGDNYRQFHPRDGFVVKGEESAEFLEESLSVLGLNRREANEFIVYWLPKLEVNPYNFIHFSTTEYEEMAKLKVTPKPETIIRVMMLYQPLSEPIRVPMQDLNQIKVERKGFTVVEWGGSLLKIPILL